jgi:hypothetical protein
MSRFLLATVSLFAFRVCLPSAARAQITLDHTASSASASVATTLVWLHQVASGNSRVLLVGVSLRSDSSSGGAGTNTIVNTITFGGVSLVCVAAFDDNNAGSCAAGVTGTVFVRSEIWALTGPIVQTASITVTTNNATTIAGISSSFFNVLSATSAGTKASNNGQTGSAAASLGPVTTTAGMIVVDNLSEARSSGTDTPTGTSQTNLVAAQPQDTAGGSFHIHGAGSQMPKTGAANPTLSWTITAGGPWADVGALLTPTVTVKRRKGQVTGGE